MDRLAVITGTTHGIGRVTSRELARAGVKVVMLCRDLARAEAVRREIGAAVPGADVQALACDLASLDSVRRCAERLYASCGPLSLLINNAGTVSMRHRQSADGFELTFATNHLGPFLLTVLLTERLAPTARIINVASRIHYRGQLQLEHVTAARGPYRAQAAYAQSKLANVLHTFARARRLSGSHLTANCLHPGVVASHLLPRWLRLVKPIISPEIIDVERGARTSVHLALAQELSGISGCYFDEHQRPQRAAPAAYDERLQERLWETSLRWTGLDRAAGSRRLRPDPNIPVTGDR
jgi:NAD(P)-dependent dehydrogenase (short-subunit alcohol dehydrogenase family)